MKKDIFAKTVGALIKERRKRLAMTAEDLACVSGLSRTSITNIENGRQAVSAYQLYEIAERLQCIRVDDLLPKKDSAFNNQNLGAWGAH